MGSVEVADQHTAFLKAGCRLRDGCDTVHARPPDYQISLPALVPAAFAAGDAPWARVLSIAMEEPADEAGRRARYRHAVEAVRRRWLMPHVQFVTTPELIKQWVDGESIGDEIVRSVLGNIEVCGNYKPARASPLLSWWRALAP